MSHHPESHGHWDVEQIDALLRERDALREQLREAQRVRDEWCAEYTKLRDSIRAKEQP